MKIACMIHSLQPGGMERVMSELVEQFVVMANTEVHLILYGRNRAIFYNLPSNVQIHIPNFRYEDQPRSLFTLKTMFFLRSTLFKLQPTTLLSFGEIWNSMVLLSLWRVPFPVFISDRSEPGKALGKVQDLLRKWLYPGATGIIAQTERAKAIYYQEFSHPNIKVIGNPIRPISQNSKPKRENTVLTVGRLIKTKHHDELIRLFAELNMPEWRLIIVGDDALKQENMVNLQQLIQDLGASNRIELTGNQEDVDSYYLRSKIFAFTSSSEGFPNVVGEALSAGLPVVSFDCVAGPSDMIQDGYNGFLVDVFDFKTFKSKLALLMSDEALRLKMAEVTAQSVDKFRKDKIARDYYNFITSQEY